MHVRSPPASALHIYYLLSVVPSSWTPSPHTLHSVLRRQLTAPVGGNIYSIEGKMHWVNVAGYTLPIAIDCEDWECANKKHIYVYMYVFIKLTSLYIIRILQHIIVSSYTQYIVSEWWWSYVCINFVNLISRSCIHMTCSKCKKCGGIMLCIFSYQNAALYKFVSIVQSLDLCQFV